jgi:hypothetical protein
MRMMLQLLIPGVQDAEESDLSAEMLGIAGDLEQRFCAAAKQQVIHYFLVLQSQRRQFVWERKNDVSVGSGQQFAPPRVKPSIASLTLTPWAMPIPARIIRDGLMTAARTLVDMATQRRRAATQDGREHLNMQPA